jgi:hypothetical protein
LKRVREEKPVEGAGAMDTEVGCGRARQEGRVRDAEKQIWRGSAAAGTVTAHLRWHVLGEALVACEHVDSVNHDVVIHAEVNLGG